MGFSGRSFRFILMLVQVLLTTVATAAVAFPQANKPNADCPNHCGGVDIPYPFGTKPGCYRNTNFLITCNHSYNPPEPFLRESTISVTNITFDGEMHIRSRVSRNCDETGRPTVEDDLSGLKLIEFTVSNKNKFAVIGCDGDAYVRGFREDNQAYLSGCSPMCNRTLKYVNKGSCNGQGCCQMDIPQGFKSMYVYAYGFKNHTNESGFNPCTYAFVVEESQFNFSTHNLSKLDRVPTILDWSITANGTCEEARTLSDYACKENTECHNPHNNSGGYLCKCKKGYRGNPYLSNGCQDINECEDPIVPHNCSHICVNLKGSYQCECREGYHAHKDEKICIPHQFPVLKVALGVGIISFMVLLVSIPRFYLVLKKRKLIKMKKKFFHQNGGFILQQQLSKQSGSSNAAKIFTEEELKKATGNYAEGAIIGQGGYGIVYKGFLADNSPVAIKMSKIVDQRQIEQFVNEVVVLSQINHRNVVRLLGCCLETEVPLLVYEFASNGTLFENIHNKDKAPTISWETRLRVAAETAGVLFYLHSAAATPIVHRDVKSTNILLDHDFTAKVSDFGASKLVPMDVTQLSTMVQGTLGYLDPEYLHTSQLTEKSDVYSFGVVLVELLTGKKAILFDRPEEERSLVMYFLSSLQKGCLFNIIDDHMARDGNEEQLKEVAELARMCLKVKGEERPTMREVAMELDGIRMMHKYSWDNAKLNAEETEYLLSATSDSYRSGDSTGTTAGYDSIRGQVRVVIDDGR